MFTFPVFRELMDGANQYKKEHEIHPLSIFFEACMRGEKDGKQPLC